MEIECETCGAGYRLESGIPVLLGPLTDQKRQQAEYHDCGVDSEFEIERPWCLPRLMRWLLLRKLDRTIRGLPLKNAAVLAVCGGSGMDAEFLARGGATVFSVDISVEAAHRAGERARRRSLAILPIVADAEHLPFDDCSIDVVYVHDGLHHLEDPRRGLREMLRVARTAIAVNEPARAAVTELAIRARLSERVEDAGNNVARVHSADILSELERHEFVISRCERYPMYYKKSLIPAFQILSLRPVVYLAQGAQLALEWLVDGAGNKLTVHAFRATTRERL